MRIISLIASATEIVCALGLEDQLVARSHECDWPSSITHLPPASRPSFPIEGSSRAIDLAVKDRLARALSIYEVDAELLKRLRPDVILTQTQCEVCAVTPGDVERALCELTDHEARIVALEPNRLGDVWEDVRRVAAACGVPERGEELVGRLRRRVLAIGIHTAKLQPKPTVATIEWIEPLMTAGNWMPELVELAGGTSLFGEAGKHSPWLEWSDLVAKDPDVLLVSPCGFGIARARHEMALLEQRPEWRQLRAVRTDRVHVADGNAYFHRPGPRLVESLEILAEILHPGALHFGHERRGWFGILDRPSPHRALHSKRVMIARRSLRCAVLAALVACAHGEPFSTPPTGTTQPLDVGPPARLTYNQAADVDAAWLPDESGLMYSGVRADADDLRCLRIMPASGGRVTRSLCPGRLDIFNEYFAATLAADSRLAFVRISRLNPGNFPSRTEVVVSGSASFTTPQTLRSVPFTIPGQPTFNFVSQLRWLGPDEVVYRAGFEGYVCDINVVCNAGTLVFVRSGMGVVRQPIDSAAGGPVLIPGTAAASSVATSEDADAIYYTLNGDSRIFRRVLSTGIATVVANLTGTIVRGAQVAGNRLVVVAGGAVSSFIAQGAYGQVQVDNGGNLVLIDLTTGVVTTIAVGTYTQPALSPSGRRLVAEAAGDLWLFDLP